MPNWVRNKITIIADNAEEIIQSIVTKDENGQDQVDFNKIVPRPESLNIISGTITNDCVNLYLNSIAKTDEFRKYITVAVLNKKNFIGKRPEDFDKDIQRCLEFDDFGNGKIFKTKDDVLAYGKQALDNLLNYGAMDWYDWSISHWGTKWNANYTEINENVVNFETAWDPVCYLFGELSKKYPNAIFHYEYSDEQIAAYCGQVTIKNGEFIEEKYYESGSIEALNFGLELWPESKSCFKYDKKKKQYVFNNETME